MGWILKENQLWPHFVSTEVDATESSGSTVKPDLGTLKNSLFVISNTNYFKYFPDI